MKITKTASGKYKLTKQAWEEIGKEAGWLGDSNTDVDKNIKVYEDNNRTLEITGPPVLDPNFIYMATIKDEYGSVESVLTEATLSEIYKWAKEHNFDIKEEQRKTAQFTLPKMMPGQEPYSKVGLSEEELRKALGQEGLCPICGEKIAIVNLTSDGRLIGSCKDAFTFAQWNTTIWDLLDDWEGEGYGIALIGTDDKVIDSYIDASDYPDMILDKSGNGAKVISGKHKGCYIVFHSGQLEDKVGQEWFPESISKIPREAQFTPPKMMPGQEPYSKDEYKKLTDMVEEAAEGDPGELEEAEVLGETIDGVPFKLIDGIKVINIIHLLSEIGGDMQSYEENSARVMRWAKEHNADYYAQTIDNFNVLDAVQQAKRNKKDIVIVEDLS